MKNSKPLPNKVIKLEKKTKSPKGASSQPLSPLTPKEKAVLDFIEEQILSSGISPSYQEIKEHFQLASFNSVQNYLKQLMEKGYVYNPPHQKRALQILHTSRAFQDAMAQKSAASAAVSTVSNVASLSKPPRDQLLQARGEVFSLPLLGRVAAGVPVERVQANEHMMVPAAFVKKPHSSFLLKVEGDSMIEDGIYEGDVLIVESAANADNGSTVVAVIDHEATVKRFYNHAKGARPAAAADGQIELRPANARLKPMWFKPDEVEIKGVVVGLMRAF